MQTELEVAPRTVEYLPREHRPEHEFLVDIPGTFENDPAKHLMQVELVLAPWAEE